MALRTSFAAPGECSVTAQTQHMRHRTVHPEKAFFTQLANDAIAKWEAMFGITGTAFTGNAQYVYQQQYGDYYAGGTTYGSHPPPILGNWESNGALEDVAVQVSEGNWVAGVVGGFTSPWMQHHVMEGLAIALDQGFPVEALMIGLSQWYTSIILNWGYPKLIGQYRLPVTRAGDGYFTLSGMVNDALAPGYKSAGIDGYWNNNIQLEDRQVAGIPGMAALVNLNAPHIAAAWTWYDANVYQPCKSVHFTDVPRFAVRPRV